MPIQKSSSLKTMRNIATTEFALDNLPALLAISDLLHNLDEYSHNALNFVKIICKPSLFNLSYEDLALMCYFSEKTIRRKCNQYTKLFDIKHSYFQTLPLPSIITRIYEFRLNNFLRLNIPSLNTISSDDIIQCIRSCNATRSDEQLCISIINYYDSIIDKFKDN